MNVDLNPALVDEIRAVSRTIVREWGFMGGDFAGTDLSPSAVHALIEIEQGGLTARDLGVRLRLEKSSVSRMLRKLVEAGDVNEEAGTEDSRIKVLSLTATGKQRVTAIHAYARGQVINTLHRLKPGQEQTVLEGMRLYTDALSAAENNSAAVRTIDIVSGYQVGIIARITEMHARYYAKEYGFGQHFESVVASGLAEFCGRLKNQQNKIWVAMQGGKIVGSVAIDGEDMGNNTAHLRWFIVGDNIRGGGAGRKLLSAAIAFADEKGFDETHLATFSGLSAARHLYESFGFTCVEEQPGSQWGKPMLEQRFVRKRPL
ncbi:GNAT family N-acetyltransferase [Undibacterium sp.]|uniref:bifunctional helix-turn-helix transcriptional regulator/GNAT family N-acetyltransferase n=1 Tax=Undibacterium sp. TaxID=1914977 RepID=UPI00374D7601